MRGGVDPESGETQWPMGAGRRRQDGSCRRLQLRSPGSAAPSKQSTKKVKWRMGLLLRVRVQFVTPGSDQRAHESLFLGGIFVENDGVLLVRAQQILGKNDREVVWGSGLSMCAFKADLRAAMAFALSKKKRARIRSSIMSEMEEKKHVCSCRSRYAKQQQ